MSDYSGECLDYIHWDARILLGEYMTSFRYVQEQVISDFTLIILEDTGLYKTNRYTGGLMRFGKGVGCSFFTKDCDYNLDNSTIAEGQTTTKYTIFENEFCAGNRKTTCSSGRLSRGICDNYYSYSLEDESNSALSRNWDLYGNEYADYCPISLSEREEKKDKIKYSYIGNCNLGNSDDFGKLAFSYWKSNIGYNYGIFSRDIYDYGEKFGKNSFCAFSSVINKNDPQQDKYKYFIRPTCYEMHCSKESLTIQINEQYIVCPRSGGYVNVGGNYMGHLLCSDFHLICSQTVPCNNMFDCVDVKSEMILDFNYNYNRTNVSSQIVLPGDTTNFSKSYELSDNGKCPKDCSQCYENKKCFVCKEGQYYIGVRENDKNPVNCSSQPPEGPYYKKKETHFFQCIEHCLKCNTSDKCLQCDPKFRLNSTAECVERIVGREDYDPNSIYKDNQTNNGYDGYLKCEKCNNSRGYYCFKENKTFCDTIKDDNKTYFNNSLGCLEKCDQVERNTPYCYRCNKDECLECKEGYHLNIYKKCLQDIDHCLIHDNNTNISQCNKCEDNYRCLNNNKTKCNYISNTSIYYYINDHIDNDCMALCSEKYDKKCIKCNYSICEDCIENYFAHESGECVEKLLNCSKHYYNNITKDKY